MPAERRHHDEVLPQAAAQREVQPGPQQAGQQAHVDAVVANLRDRDRFRTVQSGIERDVVSGISNQCEASCRLSKMSK